MRVLSDHDPYVAAWLRNLYPDAEILERDIAELKGQDLEGYERVHLFAGIGGWELALDLAGWPAGRSVWTGSCPCQPFSSAGKRKAEADERHLWPEFRRLIDECRPPTIFGEQVESKDGRRWLAGVRADLEAMGYRFGAADLCAASAGAPHIRQRLYWVADTGRNEYQHGRSGEPAPAGQSESKTQQRERRGADARRGSGTRGLALTEHDGRDRPSADAAFTGRDEPHDGIPVGSGGGVEYANGTTSTRLGRLSVQVEPEQEAGRSGDATAWSDSYIVRCADGRSRRVGTGLFPLATGVSARVAKLRAIGNSIVPQVAANFIAAYLESVDR